MFPRDLSAAVRDIAAIRPAIFLTGPRQTGKSTILRMALPEYTYISLDLPTVAQMAEDAGDEFLRRYPPPVIIDEVQYAPNLFRFLKAAIDSDRRSNGRFALTGSQHFPLFSEVTESLAGRIAILNMNSLSLHELERGTGSKAEGTQLLEWLLLGGYPEIHADGVPFDRFYPDYIATYLERDVRHILNVKNLRDFDRFLRLLASRTGHIFNLASVASDLGISPNTVKSWLSVLESTGIIKFLEPFYENFGKRVVKSPKLYFMDTGLVCFLTGIRSVEALRESSALGHLFETLAFGQLVRSSIHRSYPSNLYYFRDHSGREVDFVIPQGDKLELYECKWAEQVPRAIPAFTDLENIAGKSKILSKTLITPMRGVRRMTSTGIVARDCVDPRGDYAAQAKAAR